MPLPRMLQFVSVKATNNGLSDPLVCHAYADKWVQIDGGEQGGTLTTGHYQIQGRVGNGEWISIGAEITTVPALVQVTANVSEMRIKTTSAPTGGEIPFARLKGFIQDQAV